MSKNIYLLSNKILPHTISLPMLEVEYIKSDINFDNYDAIIFTSKSAIYAIDSFSTNWKKKDIYCIAQMTANEATKLGVDVSFIGSSGHGDDFAQELLEKCKVRNKRLLYLRGDKVVSNLVNILKCDQQVVYKTICKKYNENLTLEKNSIIIFSSPSTIECFLSNYIWDSSFIAISIGRTTSKYFPKYITPVIADTTSLQSCIDKALTITN